MCCIVVHSMYLLGVYDQKKYTHEQVNKSTLYKQAVGHFNQI
jgi:hypothetical protein